MHNIRFDSEKGIIWIVVSGPVSKNYAAEFLPEVVKVAEENKCQKLLFDIRNTLITEFLGNVLDYIVEIESIGFKKSYKIATVHTVDEEMNQFLTQNMRRQGFDYRLFTEIDEAANWLIQD